MYKFFNKEMPSSFVYWSDSSGCLHHNGEYEIKDVKDLPLALQRAFVDLWSDAYGASCYLAEYEKEYYIALEVTYDTYSSEDAGEYDYVVGELKKSAEFLASEYPKCEILFVRDLYSYCVDDKFKESVLIMLIPWDTEPDIAQKIARLLIDSAAMPFVKISGLNNDKDDQAHKDENVIYTHDEAAKIVELFEDILDMHNMKVPSPEDDERGEDNAAALYGSTYSDLLDDVENVLLDLLVNRKNADVVPYAFSGTW